MRIKQTMALVALGLCAAASGKKEYTYTGMNGDRHSIEVYTPKNHSAEAKAPCFIFFHGGGWSNGNLKAGRPICEYLASRGMVALTADYSMHSRADEAKLPQGESRKRICVMDGKTVVRWVKQHADELGVDSNRIAVGGASAGGHISVLQMMDEHYINPSDPKGVDTDVQAFVLLCPAFTILERDRTPDVNVFNHLDKEFPPSLFLMGETDNWKTASVQLIGKLIQKDADVEAWVGPGVGHMFFRTEGWVTPTNIKVDEFLVKHGLLEGQTPLRAGGKDHVLEPLKELQGGK